MRQLLCLAIFLVFPALLWAQTDPVRGDLPTNDSLKRLSLQEAIIAAQAHDPRIKAAQEEAEMYKAKAAFDLSRLLQGSYEGLLSPVTEMRGNALQSDSGDFPLQPGRPLGLFTQHKIQLIVPVFTFGKIDASRELGKLSERAAEPIVSKAQNEVAFDVQRAYFGALFADDVLDLMQDAWAQLESAEKVIEAGIDAGDFSTTDLYRLEVARGEILARASEARAALTLARTALSKLTGIEGLVHPKEDYLAQTAATLPTREDALSQAAANRPDALLLTLLRRGKEEETKLAKAALFPDIGLFAAGTLSYSNVTDDQQSPFAYDPFNAQVFSAGLGVRYSLDIGNKRSKAQELAAQTAQLADLQDAASMGFSLEVEKSYGEAKSALEKITARDKADAAAKKWLKSVLADFVVGNAETRDLTEALLASGDAHAKYLQALLDSNLALAALQKAMGISLLPIL